MPAHRCARRQRAASRVAAAPTAVAPAARRLDPL